ncbi:IS4 family transposase [Brucella sp. IR073]|uniref:IS4 family transposase n=1 Tax=unclassified Brucella TaxID=2632610 RepID=UPI003B97F82C
MRHENSVFHGLLKHIAWNVFDRLVDKYKADHRIRRLDTKSQFLALLFGQFSGAASLREIEAGLESHQARLYHLGAGRPARSTLADANAKRPAAVFADLFAHMAASASRRTRRHVADAVRILDATRLQLSSLSDGWVDTVKGARAIKLHIAFDPRDGIALEASLTSQKINDITPAKAMTIEPGMTYVFDLGFYDFRWWAELDAKGCRFVSRLKNNTMIEVAAEQAIPGDSHILSDRIGFLPQRTAHSRRSPYPDPVREITVRIETGTIIRLVTNDLDAPVEEIADLYKERWQIELFFKWIKQNLRLRRFLGTSENAVRIQVFVALIAYLVLRAAQATQQIIKQPRAFTCLVRLNLMHRRPIDALKTPPTPSPIDQRQMSLNLCAI